MKRTIIASLCLFGLMAGFVLAGEIREIELKDGSVITGEVVSLANGVYTVRTQSLGTVQLDEAKVQSIRQPGSSSAKQQPNAETQVRSLEERMRSDKDVMAKIEALKDDPQFKEILDDPALLKAIQSNDIAALMANPKFLQLMQNSTVRDIQQKMAK